MRKALFILLIGICGTVTAQIPIESFTGHERTTVDLMFFKYFKNKNGDYSRWLFFNRNRASIDYRMTKTTFLPQFGFTEAISYNHKKLKGFAPVIVAQILSWGVFPKAGVQYARINKNMTLFTWLVMETLKKPDLDYFFLIRFTPTLTEKIKLFSQIESINVFPDIRTENFSSTQRIRLGIQLKNCQFGTGADFTQTNTIPFTSSFNVGIFVRYEF